MNQKVVTTVGLAICFLGVVFNLLFGFPLILLIAAIGFIILVFGLFDYPLGTLLAVLGLRVLLDAKSELGISLGGFTLNLSALLALALIFGSALILLVKRLRIPSHALPFALFVGFGFATVAWALDPFLAVADGIRFLSYLAIFLLAYHAVAMEQHYRRFLAYFPLILVIPVVVALIQKVTGTGYLDFNVLKPLGTFFHPNYLGYASLIGCAAIAAHLSFLKEKGVPTSVSSLHWVLYGLFGVILAYFVFASGSLGAQIAFVLSLGTILLISFRRWLIAIPIAIFFASLLFPWYNYTLRNHGFSLLDNSVFRAAIGESEEDGSFVWRVRNWESVFGLIEDKPLTGWGLGSYKSLRETKFEYLTDLGALEAHNDFMNFTLEAGLVGLAFFVALFLWLFVQLFRNAKHLSSFIMIALFLSTMTAMGVENLFKGAAIMWPFFALMGALLSRFRFKSSPSN